MVRLEVTNIKNVEAALKKYGNKAVEGFGEATFDEAAKLAEIAKLKM